MPNRILGVDTASDSLTQSCLAVRDARIYPDLADLGADVTRLQGPETTSARILAALATGTDYVTACGHGQADQLIGPAGAILQVGQYPPAAVTGTIIHLLACHCGEELGPDLVVNGCRAFFGYEKKFLFPVSSPRDFVDCDGAIDRAIAAGKTADQAYRAALREFDKRIKALREDGDNHRASLVEHNRKCLVAPSRDVKWGDPDASL
jgi:hypothetical protein